MQGTFGSRLRDAMVAAGINSPTALAKRSQGGFTRQSVAKWLEMVDADLAGKHLCLVADLLRVRVKYLGTGKGPIARSEDFGGEEALETVWAMTSSATRARWLATGKRMLEEMEAEPPRAPRLKGRRRVTAGAPPPPEEPGT